MRLSFYRFEELLLSELKDRKYRYGNYFYRKSDSDRIACSLVLMYSNLAEYPGFPIELNAKRILRFVRELPQCIDIQRYAEEQETILHLIRNYEDLFFRSEFDVSGTLASINWLIHPLVARFLKRQRVETFRCLNFYCQFISKLTLEVPEIVSEIEHKWFVSNEIRSINHYHWVQQNRILDIAAKRFADITKNFITEFRSAVGQFGNGATYDTKRPEGMQAKLSSVLHGDQLDVKSFCVLSKFCSFEGHETAMFYMLLNGRRLSESIGKLQLVPKGLYKKRPITMEPVLLSYFQQKARYALERCVQDSSLQICFEDQELSKELALEGSRYSTIPTSYATRDLSSASDDITIALVKRLCKYCPEVYELLSYLRTDYVEDSYGNKHEVFSYAGMGNAVTFRLESIVFAILVETAIKLKNSKKDSIIHISEHDYRVYGDDIIVPNYVVDTLDWVLDQLHFTVNRDKSYDSSTSFREACGIEAYKGYDVTPIRLSRKIKPECFLLEPCPLDQVSSLLAYLKTIHWYFDKSRRFLTKKLLARNEHLRCLPFVGESDQFGFPSTNISDPIIVHHSVTIPGKLVGYCNRCDELLAIYSQKEIVSSEYYYFSLTEKSLPLDEESAYYDMQTKLAVTGRNSLSLPDDVIRRTPGRVAPSRCRFSYELVRSPWHDEVHVARTARPLLTYVM